MKTEKLTTIFLAAIFSLCSWTVYTVQKLTEEQAIVRTKVEQLERIIYRDYKLSVTGKAAIFVPN